MENTLSPPLPVKWVETPCASNSASVAYLNGPYTSAFDGWHGEIVGRLAKLG